MATHAQSHTSYDEDWSDDFDDFAIPDYLDIVDFVRGGRPGIHMAETNDLVDQSTAPGCYPANAPLTVAENTRLKRIDDDFEEPISKSS